MRSARLFLFPLLLAALSMVAASCGDSPTAPSSAPFSQTDLRVGTGAEAVAGKVLTVHYTGWLWDPAKPDQKGLQFETSRGTSSFSFRLGAGGLIEGWERGLVGMRVGGLRRLVVPPSMAYGETRNGPIPPNSTLVFEVEVLDVQDPV
ncbi:MAG TPA: FKBP-type peptidyl-prolyl cis-trans isomerase [Vicinamibacterales bacterium]|nr:FKBP-type peptidyl-prolyl cis-trans isomerase [Vicinamibacterales bacterium]